MSRKWMLALVACLTAAPSGTAWGQYMFMDTDSDGVYTASDVLPVGGFVPVDIWLRTDAGRGGTAPLTSSSDPSRLTVNSYEFVVRADGGRVEWGSYTNYMTAMPFRFGPRQTETEYTDGFGGATYVSAGKHRLGRLMVRVVSGSPSLKFLPLFSAYAAYLTGFGSECVSKEGDHTLKLGAPAEGGKVVSGSSIADWSDADGISVAGGGALQARTTESALPKRLSIGTVGSAPLRGPKVALRLGLPARGHVSVRVFDVRGRLVRTVADDQLEAGWHDLTWDAVTSDGRRVANGQYFLAARWEGKLVRQKILLLR